MIVPRLITAAIGLPLVIVTLRIGGLVWIGFVGLLTLLAVTEAIHLFNRATGSRTRPLEGLLGSSVVLAGAIAAAMEPSSWPFLFVSPVAAAFLALFLFMMADGNRPLTDFETVWAAAVYPALGFSFLLLLRHGSSGFDRVLATLAIVWVGDVAAYAFGSLIGGPKAFPGISPHKTWAGSLSGWLAAVITAYGVHAGLGVSPWVAAGIGAGVGILAQFGDLAESLLKRRAAVKDSGVVLPGHGGVLDRFDGVIAVAPWMWLVLFLLHRLS